MTGHEFVGMLCRHYGRDPISEVNRIEFEYTDGSPCGVEEGE